MISVREELGSLKDDLVSLQTFLKEKIASLEIKIKEIESKISINNADRRDEPDNENSHELDNQTRNIIEELMWQSTLSEGVFRVRKLFKDTYSREKFLRCCLELVLEKDEQYRKMAGSLFGNLISHNVVNQANIFNSLSSVLLVIENSNSYNTKLWQNLTDILLPMITESHIKLFQLQRRAQTILKSEYYREFSFHLNNAVEGNRKHKFKNKSCDGMNLNNSATFGHSTNLQIAEKKDFKMDLPLTDALQADCTDMQNIYDFESVSKYRPIMENAPIQDSKLDIGNLIDNLTSEGLENAFRRIKELSPTEMKSSIELIMDKGMQKEPEHRLVIGTLLAALYSEGLVDLKILFTAVCNSIFKVQTLVMNQNTRVSICEAFADLLLPLFADGKVKLNQLSMVASLSLPEETKTVFLWFVEKALIEKGLTERQPVASGTHVTSKLMRRIKKYMEKDHARREMEDDKSEVKSDEQKRPPSVQVKKREKSKNNENTKPERRDVSIELSEHDKFMALKRKKLLKERIENVGDEMDIKIDDLLNEQINKKFQEGETSDSQLRQDNQKVEVEQQIAFKQPENLPSSAIKEKMEEIIEHLMETGNMEECVSIVKETFNECQTDLVFKAAFEYTKDKSSEHRIQSGVLVSEAFKHDPRRVGAQIMNTISLELGDFVDTPELWNNMAEIICPAILNGLIRFIDLKLLPKYFLHTNHCASLLLAIFNLLIRQSGPEWLEENWKKSKLELSVFVPTTMIYKFVVENNLQFILKNDELSQYQKSASE